MLFISYILCVSEKSYFADCDIIMKSLKPQALTTPRLRILTPQISITFLEVYVPQKCSTLSVTK